MGWRSARLHIDRRSAIRQADHPGMTETVLISGGGVLDVLGTPSSCLYSSQGCVAYYMGYSKCDIIDKGYGCIMENDDMTMLFLY